MILLVGSSQLCDHQLKYYAKEASHTIAVDGGLNHFIRVGITPQEIMGDFDSYQGDLPQGVQIFPKEKDFSDLEAALKKVGDKEAVLLGVTGGRLDHFLSAVNLLKNRENLRIIDEQNELFYRRERFFLKKREGYFSLFPDCPTRICIQGAKYELHDRWVTGRDSLLLSNEWMDDVEISIENGGVLVVLSRDKKNP